MANKVLMVRADLNEQQRSMLLSAFPPRYPNVYCRHMVWAYGVPEDFVYPKDEPVTFTVTGRHLGHGHEALVGVASFDGDGDEAITRQANNDKLLHITLSTDDGIAPVKGGEIEPAGMIAFNPVPVPLRLILHLVLGHPMRLIAERR
jgi:hypothetical protein